MKFNTGDKVRVRSLEAMKREFGLGEYDEPNTSLEFTPQMDEEIKIKRELKLVLWRCNMMLYSYKCNNCNERLVTDKPIEEIKEPEPFKCPQCKKDMLKEYTTIIRK